MNIIDSVDIKDLKNYKFRIPLYQRPYAWGEDEIIQLIADLKSFKEKNSKKKYFVGNIVVSENSDFYDVIDGQQRLTTLYLLMKYLRLDTFELHYEIREEDDEFLKNIDFNTPNSTFKEAIKIIQKTLSREDKELIEQISLTITFLPKEVDVVKYFEVMNNRGKQLEKHQILKAKFLEILKFDNEYDYSKIWDYCSEINLTIEDLIYYNDFKKDEKKEGAVFKLRKNLLEFKFDNYFKKENSNNHSISILNALEKKEDEEEKDYKSRKYYRSIVKFTIFLIQVLKMFIIKNNLEDKDFKSLKEIIVNDRYLLKYFYKDENYTNFLFDANLAKEFILFLLKIRILFDYFIFKRDEKDAPILIGRENKNLTMIQLLFNFTSPQYFSQDWILVYLMYLYLNKKDCFEIKKDKIFFKDDNLVGFLEELDRKLALIRLENKDILEFLNKESRKINENKSTKQNYNIDDKKLEEILNQGTSTPHYWFYKLDYLLWKKYNWEKEFCCKFDNLGYSKIKENFRLTRLNSIEHIYPQSKKEDFEKGGCNIDCFGNLVLISNHMNSKLIDKEFENKRLMIQEQINNGTIESLKMILVYSKYSKWDCNNCKEHQKEMINILVEDLKG